MTKPLNEIINELRRENEQLRRERDVWQERAMRHMRDNLLTTPAPVAPHVADHPRHV